MGQVLNEINPNFHFIWHSDTTNGFIFIQSLCQGSALSVSLTNIVFDFDYGKYSFYFIYKTLLIYLCILTGSSGIVEEKQSNLFNFSRFKNKQRLHALNSIDK